jgi:hypothetical protein
MRWLTFIHKKSQQPAIAAVAALLLLISGRVPDGFYTLCITKLKLNSGNMSPSSPFALFSLHLSLGARGAELLSGNCVSRFIPLPPEPLFYSKLYTHQSTLWVLRGREWKNLYHAHTDAHMVSKFLQEAKRKCFELD